MNKIFTLFFLLGLISCQSNKIKENPNKKINLQEIFTEVDINNDNLIDLNESFLYSQPEISYNYSSPSLIFGFIVAVVLSTCFFPALVSFLKKNASKVE